MPATSVPCTGKTQSGVVSLGARVPSVQERSASSKRTALRSLRIWSRGRDTLG